MVLQKYIILINFIFWFTTICGANNAINTISRSDTTKVKNQLLGYPIAYYLPETGFGGGFAGFYTFRFKGETTKSNPSQILTSLSYTQKNQVLLSAISELYKFENKLKIKAELGYFKYRYNFFGIGPNSLKSNLETYEVAFPRVRLDVLNLIGNTYIGLRYRFDSYGPLSFNPEGRLKDLDIKGKLGGIISGIGLITQHDTRDYIYFPTKGYYIEAEIYTNKSWTGSDFNYTRFGIDAATYFDLKRNRVIALNLITSVVSGNAPFNDLPYFGSPRIMRGTQDRRFIGNSFLTLQSEYRFPIYKIISGVGFCSAGNVSDKYGDLFSKNNETPLLHIAFGAGIRILVNKADRIRVRLDYGHNPGEGGAFYITINDAF